MAKWLYRVIIFITTLLFTSQLNAINVSTVEDLWDIRDNLGGDYTLITGINLEDTNPNTISTYTVGTYNTNDIVEYTDGYAYYCSQDGNTNTPDTENGWTKMWEVSKGWDPIGDETSPFHGNFDGGGYVISNLYINRLADSSNNTTFPANGENFVGLFGFVTNGSTTSNASNSSDIYINNLGLTNVNIKGKRATGSLIGKVDLPNQRQGKLVIVDKCYVNGGTVAGFGATGGLVGANNSQRKQVVPIVRYCWADVTVSSTHPNNQSLNSGDNNNPYNIKYGGLVGCNENGLTQDSFSLGDVSGGDRVGGVAGCSIGGAIFRTYSTSNVTQNIGSSSWQGGYGPITGRVEGKLPPGLGGTNAIGSLEDSYYLDTSAITGTNDDNTYGTSQTSSQLSNATSYPNWDNNVWDFTTDYPTLQSSPSSIFYFKSKNSGAFSTVSNWENSSTENGTYTTSVIKPDYTNSVSIKVLSGDTITLANGKSAFISSTTVEGNLAVASGGVLNIENESGDDLIIAGNGSLEVTGTLNIGQSATLIGETNSTITFNGTTSQSLPSGLSSVYNLTIDNSSGVTLPDTLTINGTLTVTSGNYTGANNVTVDGIYSPAVKHLVWPKTDFNIENYSSSTSLSSLYPTYINRSWTLTGNIDDASTDNREKTITFYWDADDDANHDWVGLSQTPVLFEGGSKVSTATSSNLSGNIRSATYVYTFPENAKATRGNLTIGLENQTLPCELSSFNAMATSTSSVALNWTVQSESNGSGYRVYRNNSNDLNTATMLETFIPAHNLPYTHTYTFNDEEIINATGQLFYWIKFIELDNSYTNYGPVFVQFEIPNNDTPPIIISEGIKSTYPNPFNPTVTISYYVKSPKSVTFEIYNVKGQLIKTLVEYPYNEGVHQVNWNGKDDFNKNVASGVYFVKSLNLNDNTPVKVLLSK